ncbi:MAG: hypothetical protein K0R50_1611, partial [Eubacterium sp.]|nr:hypothetical protein [Eubacterium sp.]
MTNEEFQSLVLGELRGIRGDINNLKEGQTRLEHRLERVENKLDAVYEQTAILTEFRTEANMKLDKLVEDNRSIHEIIGRHEVDITTLKRKYA